MTTLTKIIVYVLLSLSVFSCNFDLNFGTGIRGNGNVQSEDRAINASFTAIKASHGLDVYLTQGDKVSLRVQADENLHDLIETVVEDGVLRIYARKNIGFAASKKIMVSFKDISKITSTSGSDVYSTNTITTESLELKTTSGSDMELDVNTSSLDCKSTSGSDLRLSGKTDKLYAEATSGSDIKAGNLKAKSSNVKATSGADITVNTSFELNARATSGGDIKYLGNPEKVSKSDGVSGSIRKL